MKNKHTKTTGLLVLLILAGHSNADTVTKSLTPVAVTVALTSKFAAPQLTAINPDTGEPDTKLPKVASTEVTTEPNLRGDVTTIVTVGVKPATRKVDNAAVIAAALELDSELTPAKRAEKIRGWTLLADISIGAEALGAQPSGGELTYNVYASKNGEAIKELFSISLSGPLTESYSASETRDEEGNIISAKAPTGSTSYEGVAGAKLGESSTFSGLLSVSTKVTAWNPDTNNKTAYQIIAVPAAGKLASIIGSDGSGATLTGTISFAAPKVVTQTVKVTPVE
jgi:hypothetical protein